MQLLQFKPNFHISIIDCEQLVLFSEDKHHLLQGSIYVAIAELIHSCPMSEEVITETLLPKFPLECIKEAFIRLKKKGFLSKFSDKIPRNVSAFWSDLTLDAEVSVKPSIVIKNFSQHSSSDLATALGNLSLKVDDESGDFFIVIVDNYICEELALFNKARLQDKKPWMLLKPSGRIIWIGPIFEPSHTGCWNCLAEKLKENRRVEIDLFGLSNSNLNIPSLSHLPTTQIIAMNIAANEVAKWEKSQQSHQLYNNLLTLDLGDMKMCLHSFKTLVTCTSCQLPQKRLKQPFPILKSSPKKYFFDEGERFCSLDDTLQNLNATIS